MVTFWLIALGVSLVAVLRSSSRSEEDAYLGRELKPAEVVDIVDEDEELTNKIISAAQQAGICKTEIEANIHPKLKKDQDNGKEA